MKRSTKRKTLKEIKKECKNLTNNEFLILSEEYINNKVKLEFLHNISSPHKFKKSWHDFSTAKNKCPICYNVGTDAVKYCKEHKMNIQEVTEKIIKLYPHYSVLSTEYINNKAKLDLHCNICNIDFKARWNDLQQGLACCPSCKREKFRKKFSFSYDYVKDFIEQSGEYELISDTYINADTKLKIKHLKCGNIFYKTFDLFKNQCQGCTYCKPKSKGEELIKNYLIDNNIKFNNEYKFKDCKNILSLPFDFYLEDYNMCIEFDGIQHYRPVEKFGGEERFKETKKNDKIKTQYCVNNNITLLRIPYFKIKKINEILDFYFKN